MSKKRYRPEEIVSKLREVDIFVGQGKTVALAIKETGVSEVTYYRQGQEYGKMSTSQKTGTHKLCVPV